MGNTLRAGVYVVKSNNLHFGFFIKKREKKKRSKNESYGLRRLFLPAQIFIVICSDKLLTRARADVNVQA